MRNRGMFLIVMAVTLVMGVLWAGPVGPVGPEFQVNTYTTSEQSHPSVGMDGLGNFVVVWKSWYQDGGFWGVYGRRYDASGTAQDAVFQVNTYTTGDQDYPSVAMDESGNFVVVWESWFQDGSNDGVYGQRYDSSGVAQGDEFQVNTYTAGDQSFPSVAMDSSGNFVVVWESYGQDGHERGVYGQRYDASGTAQGSEFQINTYTTLNQMNPSVGMDGAGNFVVAWESYDQDGEDVGIYGQRYDALGAAQGTEFQINTYTANYQENPSVCMNSAGNFVVAWENIVQDGNSGVYGQRYDASGVAQGAEFQVNTYPAAGQRNTSVGMDSASNFVVAWQSYDQDGDNSGVYGQRYDALGVAQGTEFQIDSYTTGLQRNPSVGMDRSGNVVIVWDSYDENEGIFGQRYDFVPPTVAIIATTSPSLTEGGTLAFNVTFSEAVTGVDVSDFALSITGDIPDAVIVNVTGSGSEYTVFVGDVAGDGTLRLDLIDDDSIIDGDGIPLGGVGVGNGDFTTGGVYQVVPQLPIATWPVALVLLVLGIMGSLFYTTQRRSRLK